VFTDNRRKEISGIPQGSILGPILFTIFINDLPDNLNSNCKIFADDTKLYTKPDSNLNLQNDIDTLVEWSNTWNLYFNATKCKIMHIGNTNPEREYVMREEDNETKLKECEEEKDLGVTFDRELLFDRHIANVVSKANQMLGIIRRTFTCIDKDIFTRLYKTLVRPHLEYGNCIWSPRLKRQSAEIEKVQRRATKLVHGLENYSYKERLQVLKLPSLKARRIRGDLIQTYKIFNDVDDIDKDFFFEFPCTNITRNSTDKIHKQHHNCNLRKFSFSYRVTDLWNALTTSTKRAPKTNQFKNLIDKSKDYTDIIFDYDD
jgi:hypothetical protein